MRMLAALKRPCPIGPWATVRRVMLHETETGEAYAYLYAGPDDLFCSGDILYPSLEEAWDAWGDAADAAGWALLEDPPPGCPHDCPLPVRVKAASRQGYEIFQDGEWRDFAP